MHVLGLYLLELRRELQLEGRRHPAMMVKTSELVREHGELSGRLPDRFFTGCAANVTAT